MVNINNTVFARNRMRRWAELERKRQEQEQAFSQLAGTSQQMMEKQAREKEKEQKREEKILKEKKEFALLLGKYHGATGKEPSSPDVGKVNYRMAYDMAKAEEEQRKAKVKRDVEQHQSTLDYRGVLADQAGGTKGSKTKELKAAKKRAKDMLSGFVKFANRNITLGNKGYRSPLGPKGVPLANAANAAQLKMNNVMAAAASAGSEDKAIKAFNLVRLRFAPLMNKAPNISKEEVDNMVSTVLKEMMDKGYVTEKEMGKALADSGSRSGRGKLTPEEAKAEARRHMQAAGELNMNLDEYMRRLKNGTLPTP